MSRVSALYDLQQTDSKIDSQVTSIANIEKALEDTSAVDTAAQTTGDAEVVLVAARLRLRELEADATKQEQHANELEKKLYGGDIKGQKELAAAQQEIETFRQRKKETDDQSVSAMESLEKAEKGLKEAKQKQAATEAEWQRATGAYQEELTRLQKEVAANRADREKRVKMVMPADLPLYDRLRQQKQGVAVAEILAGGKICAKCRVELPMAKQREVKGGTNIVTCSSCGRILYHRF